MRLIMLGTGPFAVPTFRALYTTRHTVAALVTSPIRTHRGKPVASVSSMREVAQQYGTPIFDPEDVNLPDGVARLASFEADLLITCDYGQILSRDALATARQGGVNLHASLLPKYRGAAPINWALYHGETETGVTVIHMSPQIDAGPCIAQAGATIRPEETAADLEPRLAELGARLVRESIDLLDAGRARPLPQDPALTSRAPRLKKHHGGIDWNRSAVEIQNQVRALEPWPRTFTFWHRAEEPPMRLILGPVSVAEGETAAMAPGTVLEAAGSRLVIAAGQGVVIPTSVQPAGKRLMAIEEFLRGQSMWPGEWFGEEESDR